MSSRKPTFRSAHDGFCSAPSILRVTSGIETVTRYTFNKTYLINKWIWENRIACCHAPELTVCTNQRILETCWRRLVDEQVRVIFSRWILGNMCAQYIIHYEIQFSQNWVAQHQLGVKIQPKLEYLSFLTVEKGKECSSWISAVLWVESLWWPLCPEWCH